MHSPKQPPVVLLVLDGFGIAPPGRGNAIREAQKPNLDTLAGYYPFTTLQASGVAVGLPWGEAGNSEVGHLTMGAGRAIYHHLPRIITAIHDGTFYTTPAFQRAAAHVRKQKSALHLIGLVSSGSVHSYLDHLFALLEFAKREKISQVWVHAICDGKDAPPREGRDFFPKLEARMRDAYPNAHLASLVGRFFAMDRDDHWDRIRQTYELLVGHGGGTFTSAAEWISRTHRAEGSDEFVTPGSAVAPGGRTNRITSGDAIIFFNFREDSMRELTEAFALKEFPHFHREPLERLFVATMTKYEDDLPGVEAAFPPLEIHWPLGRVLAEAGKKQLRIAESEKYAHVTYFFNGGTETPFLNEERALIQSLNATHFDEEPAMKAPEITERILASLGSYDFILANFANADMVGHTGNYAAVVRAIEVLDQCLGNIAQRVDGLGGTLIITADHGNAEQKIHPISGEMITEHTANPVPFYLISRELKRASVRPFTDILKREHDIGGILTDVAPTVLELMNIPKPAEMTGRSLLPILRQE